MASDLGGRDDPPDGHSSLIMRRRISDLERERNDLQRELERLSTVDSSQNVGTIDVMARMQARRTASLEKELADLKHSNATLTMECTDLQQELTQAYRAKGVALDSLKAEQRKREKLEEDVKFYQAQVGNTLVERDKCLHELDIARAKISDLEFSNSFSSEKIQGLEADVEKYKNSSKDADEALSKIRGEMTSALEDMTKALDQSEERIARASNEIATLRMALSKSWHLFIAGVKKGFFSESTVEIALKRLCHVISDEQTPHRENSEPTMMSESSKNFVPEDSSSLARSTLSVEKSDAEKSGSVSRSEYGELKGQEISKGPDSPFNQGEDSSTDFTLEQPARNSERSNISENVVSRAMGSDATNGRMLGTSDGFVESLGNTTAVRVDVLQRELNAFEIAEVVLFLDESTLFIEGEKEREREEGVVAYVVEGERKRGERGEGTNMREENGVELERERGSVRKGRGEESAKEEGNGERGGTREKREGGRDGESEGERIVCQYCGSRESVREGAKRGRRGEKKREEEKGGGVVEREQEKEEGAESSTSSNSAVEMSENLICTTAKSVKPGGENCQSFENADVDKRNRTENVTDGEDERDENGERGMAGRVGFEESDHRTERKREKKGEREREERGAEEPSWSERRGERGREGKGGDKGGIAERHISSSMNGNGNGVISVAAAALELAATRGELSRSLRDLYDKHVEVKEEVEKLISEEKEKLERTIRQLIHQVKLAEERLVLARVHAAAQIEEEREKMERAREESERREKELRRLLNKEREERIALGNTQFLNRLGSRASSSASKGGRGNQRANVSENTEATDDLQELLHQVMEEKVQALLLLSQEEERSHLELCTSIALREALAQTREKLIQATREKVDSLLTVAHLRAEVQKLEDMLRSREQMIQILKKDFKQQSLGYHNPTGGMLPADWSVQSDISQPFNAYDLDSALSPPGLPPSSSPCFQNSAQGTEHKGAEFLGHFNGQDINLYELGTEREKSIGGKGGKGGVRKRGLGEGGGWWGLASKWGFSKNDNADVMMGVSELSKNGNGTESGMEKPEGVVGEDLSALVASLRIEVSSLSECIETMESFFHSAGRMRKRLLLAVRVAGNGRERPSQNLGTADVSSPSLPIILEVQTEAEQLRLAMGGCAELGESGGESGRREGGEMGGGEREGAREGEQKESTAPGEPSLGSATRQNSQQAALISPQASALIRFASGDRPGAVSGRFGLGAKLGELGGEAEREGELSVTKKAAGVVALAGVEIAELILLLTSHLRVCVYK